MTTHQAQVNAAQLSVSIKILIDDYVASGTAYLTAPWAKARGNLFSTIDRLAARASAPPAPAASEPVAWEWRKRHNTGLHQGEPYFVWSEWEPLAPPYMDARDLAKTDPKNYELRALYTAPQPPAASSDALDAPDGEPSLDPDGDVSLDWSADGGILSISVNQGGQASYAWLLDDGTKQHGTVELGGGAFVILRAALKGERHRCD